MEERKLLLTGATGSGKTFIAERVIESLSDVRIGGFITREMYDRGGLMSIFLASASGGQGHIIAHRDYLSEHRTGQLGVDVEVIDYAADALVSNLDVDLWVLDEVGPMQLLSKRFVAAFKTLLAGDTPLLATINLSGNRLIERMKEREDVIVGEVSEQNRDNLRIQVIAWARSVI